MYSAAYAANGSSGSRSSSGNIFAARIEHAANDGPTLMAIPNAGLYTHSGSTNIQFSTGESDRKGEPGSAGYSNGIAGVSSAAKA